MLLRRRETEAGKDVLLVLELQLLLLLLEECEYDSGIRLEMRREGEEWEHRAAVL